MASAGLSCPRCVRIGLALPLTASLGDTSDFGGRLLLLSVPLFLRKERAVQTVQVVQSREKMALQTDGSLGAAVHGRPPVHGFSLAPNSPTARNGAQKCQSSNFDVRADAFDGAIDQLIS